MASSIYKRAGTFGLGVCKVVVIVVALMAVVIVAAELWHVTISGDITDKLACAGILIVLGFAMFLYDKKTTGIIVGAIGCWWLGWIAANLPFVEKNFRHMDNITVTVSWPPGPGLALFLFFWTLIVMVLTCVAITFREFATQNISDSKAKIPYHPRMNHSEEGKLIMADKRSNSRKSFAACVVLLRAAANRIGYALSEQQVIRFADITLSDWSLGITPDDLNRLSDEAWEGQVAVAIAADALSAFNLKPEGNLRRQQIAAGLFMELDGIAEKLIHFTKAIGYGLCRRAREEREKPSS